MEVPCKVARLRCMNRFCGADLILCPHTTHAAPPLFRSGSYQKQSGQVGTVGTWRIYWVCAVPTFPTEVGTVGTSCPIASYAVQSLEWKPLQNSGRAQCQCGRGLQSSGEGCGGHPAALQPALRRGRALQNAARKVFTAARQTAQPRQVSGLRVAHPSRARNNFHLILHAV